MFNSDYTRRVESCTPLQHIAPSHVVEIRKNVLMRRRCPGPLLSRFWTRRSNLIIPERDYFAQHCFPPSRREGYNDGSMVFGLEKIWLLGLTLGPKMRLARFIRAKLLFLQTIGGNHTLYPALNWRRSFYHFQCYQRNTNVGGENRPGSWLVRREPTWKIWWWSEGDNLPSGSGSKYFMNGSQKRNESSGRFLRPE